MNSTMYLIDGVRVSKRIFLRRKVWGEHAAARFQQIEIPRQVPNRR